MAKIRVGVRHFPSANGPAVETSPEWVEINGYRIPDDWMIQTITHEMRHDSYSVATISLVCGGFETVPIEDEP